MIYTSKLSVPSIPTGDSIYHVIFKNDNNVPLNKPILIDIEAPYRTLTYEQLKKQILVAAAGLKREFNIQKNDVVAICSPNHMDYVSILHGTICAGGIVAPLHYTSPVEDIAYDMKTVQAKFLISHEETIDKALAAAKIAGITESNIVIFGKTGIQGIRSVDDTLLKGDEEAEPLKYTSEQMQNDAAVLYFTSGTTGRKKAVIRTQINLLCSVIKKNINTNSVVLSYLDFNHSTSLVAIMLISLYYGCTNHLLNHYSFRGLCSAIERYKSTYISCAPYVISSLIKDPIAREYDISSLNVLGSCGAVLKKAVIEDAKKKLGIIVLDIYGLTEVLSLFVTTPEVSAVGGVGYLNGGFTARLIDENGQDVSEGQMGELLIKGPSLTPGYYNVSESITDADGYFNTGDLFKCNENGVFYFCDRSKDLMKYYGTQIYPSEIEEVLIKHPKVADCAAIGVYQPEVAAEFPRAYVLLIDGEHNLEEIAKELQVYSDSQLPEKKQIRAGIIIVDSFPRTSSGKIQRRLLRQTANSIQVLA